MRDPRDGYTADEMNAMVRGETTPQELLEAGVGQDAAALDRSGDTEPASGTSAALGYGRAAVFILSAIPVGILASWLSGGSGLAFAIVLVLYMLGGFTLVVRSGLILRPEERVTKGDLQAMWAVGEPVALVSEWRHSSLCATTATGHRGRCTCGADPRG